MKIADLSKLNQLKMNFIKNEVVRFWLTMSDECIWLGSCKLFENMLSCISTENLEIIDQLCNLTDYSSSEYLQLIEYIKSDTETISFYLTRSGMLVEGGAISNIQANIDDSLHSLVDLNRLK